MANWVCRHQHAEGIEDLLKKTETKSLNRTKGKKECLTELSEKATESVEEETRTKL